MTCIRNLLPLSSSCIRARASPLFFLHNLDSPTRCSFQVFLPPSLRLLINDRVALFVPSVSRESRVERRVVKRGRYSPRRFFTTLCGIIEAPGLIYRAFLLLIGRGKTYYMIRRTDVSSYVRHFHFFSGKLRCD